MMRRRWTFGLKCQFEMTDNPIDRLRFFDKRDDSHLTATGRTETTGLEALREEKREKYAYPYKMGFGLMAFTLRE